MMVSEYTGKIPLFSTAKLFILSLLELYFSKDWFLMFSNHPLFPQDTEVNYFTSMLPGKASRKPFVSLSSPFVLRGFI